MRIKFNKKLTFRPEVYYVAYLSHRQSKLNYVHLMLIKL